MPKFTPTPEQLARGQAIRDRRDSEAKRRVDATDADLRTIWEEIQLLEKVWRNTEALDLFREIKRRMLIPNSEYDELYALADEIGTTCYGLTPSEINGGLPRKPNPKAQEGSHG